MFFLVPWKDTFWMMLLKLLMKIFTIHSRMSKPCVSLRLKLSQYWGPGCCVVLPPLSEQKWSSKLQRAHEGQRGIYVVFSIIRKIQDTFHLFGACFMFWSWSQSSFLKSETVAETLSAIHQATVTQGCSSSLYQCFTGFSRRELCVTMRPI